MSSDGQDGTATDRRDGGSALEARARSQSNPSRSEVRSGAHLCQFYNSPAPPRDLLLSYLAAGLAQGERCLWVVREEPSIKAAEAAALRVLEDARRHFAEGRLEVVRGDDWSRDGRLDVERLVAECHVRERAAVEQGLSGLRVAVDYGDTDLRSRELADNETRLREGFASHHISALCAYRLREATPNDAIADGAPRASGHEVHLLGEPFPAKEIAAFLAEMLRAGGVAMAVATRERLDAIVSACAELEIDPAAAQLSGSFVVLDAEATLSRFMRDGKPDRSLFDEVIAAPLRRLCAGDRGARVYGEMVDVLWARGERDAALALEELWNELIPTLPMSLLCGYSMDTFGPTQHLQDVLSAHGHLPQPGRAEVQEPDARRLAAELKMQSRHVALEIERRREAEEAERTARRQLRAAHERLARLQSITSALSEAASPEDIGRVATGRVPRLLGADQAILLVPFGNDELQLLAHSGLTREVVRDSAAFPVRSHLPAAEAFRTARPVWIESVAERDARYPELRGSRTRATCCVPIIIGSRRLGVLGFGYFDEHRVSSMDRTLMQDIARQVGSALDRARLYDAARRNQTELHAANRRKDEFLALLGHELRNPLAPILTALYIMKLRGDAGAEREREMIERHVLHVSRLVDDLLDVSRITRGKLELRKSPVKLEAVLKQAIEIASPLIEQRRHHVTLRLPDEAVWVHADAVRLAQAVANLLTNAAKYTDPGGTISVCATTENGHAAISVRDTGVGIPEEMLAHVFEPFTQLQRTLERGQGGLGIGLALVKSLVELHDGTVSGRSEGPGRGSEFVIRIPVLDLVPSAAEQGQPPRLSRLPACAARRVLVVDDNRDAADGLADILTALGHEAHVAYDGAEALEKARIVRPEVALMDLNLPVMDGYEVARRIRELPELSHVRFIAVTGFGTDADRARSRAAGFADHLVKPIEQEKLLRAVTE